MADILKITTPLVDKNQISQQHRPSVDPSTAFDLPDISKVLKPEAQAELLKQNNGMIEKEQAPTILMDLLKDPSVTVNFLKNIFMLQEIIKLLPANNQPFTQEFEQLFNQLLVRPEEIVPELLRQENTSTSFKGDLFTLLRQIIADKPQPELRYAVANLLKSINAFTDKQDVLNSVANSLQFLSESLEASKSLSERLASIAARFRRGDAPELFRDLKSEAFALAEEVEQSILFSPKLAKVVSIMYYNMSRYNDNPDFFQESVASLLTLLDGKQQRSTFLMMVRSFLDSRDGEQEPSAQESSKIMTVLAKLLGKQSSDPNMSLMNQEKIEKIIVSLLSSPCNYTPLLHFVIPVEYLDLKSFAEIWINPNGGEDERPAQSGKDSIHMLIVFDIEGIGQFEAELFVVEELITLSLLCPPAYTGFFMDMQTNIARCASGTNFRFGDIKVGKMERPRSLMDVFKSLPYKRTGVDVKV